MDHYGSLVLIYEQFKDILKELKISSIDMEILNTPVLNHSFTVEHMKMMSWDIGMQRNFIAFLDCFFDKKRAQTSHLACTRHCNYQFPPLVTGNEDKAQTPWN